MSIHTAGWAAIGSVITAVVSIGVTAWLASRNRSLMIEQAASQLLQAAAALDVQRTSTARTAATFIADKRQKWIDELRVDVSQYVALTAEMTEAWKRIFARLGNRWDRHEPNTQDDLDQFDDDVMNFASSIADRDSQHHQLLTRIVLRVNHEELAHKGLVNALSKIRSLLGDIAINAARQVYANQEKYAAIEQELRLAHGYSKVIFYEEWRKLKREVADPEKTMNSIIATTAPDDAAVKALVDAGVASVPSSLSTENVELIKAHRPLPRRADDNQP